MKTTRMLYKRANFSSGKAGKAKMKASLEHSILRPAPQPLSENDTENDGEYKKNEWEWNVEKTKDNLILIDGEILTFENFNEAKRAQLIEKIAPKSKLKNEKDKLRKRQNYKSKMLNAIEKEPGVASILMQEIIQAKPDELIPGHLILELEKTDMKRKDQRLKMCRTYIEAHNDLVGFVNKNVNFLQEGLFKFPKPHAKNVEKYGLTEIKDEIKPQEYITHVQNFLTEHFPNYKIKTIVAHVDETKVHSHYFLDGKNKVTGNYDLAKREIEIVNDYIKKTVSPEEWEQEKLPKGRKLKYYEQKRFGRYYQRLFFKYTNDRLLNERGINAEIAPQTERDSEAAKETNRQAKLNISERDNNYMNYQIDQAKAELGKTKEEDQELQKKMEFTGKIIADQVAEMAQNKELTSDLKAEVEQIKEEHKTLYSALSGLKDEFVERFLSVTQLLMVKAEFMFKDNPKKADEYTIKIMSNYAVITDKPCRDLCIGAAQAFEDIEVVDLMNQENEKVVVQEDKTDDLNKTF